MRSLLAIIAVFLSISASHNAEAAPFWCDSWIRSLASQARPIHFENVEPQSFEAALLRFAKNFSENSEERLFIENGFRKITELKMLVRDSPTDSFSFKSQSILRLAFSKEPYRQGTILSPLDLEITEVLARQFARMLLIVQLKPVGIFTFFRQNPAALVKNHHELFHAYFRVLKSLQVDRRRLADAASLAAVIATLALPIIPERAAISTRPNVVGAKTLSMLSFYQWVSSAVIAFTSSAIISYGLYASPYVFKARMKFVEHDKMKVSREEKAEMKEIFQWMDMSTNEVREKIFHLPISQSYSNELRKFFDDREKESTIDEEKAAPTSPNH
jgi:hypothetical protein